MRKIVLYNPATEKVFYKKGENAPLALLAISAFLDKDGYNINIYDQRDVDKLLLSVKDSICLGITCMTGYQIKDGLNVAKIVKKKYPDVPIVWGGWHPTLLPLQTIRNKYVDIVVRGQGERTFTELVHALESNGDLSKIAGLTYKKDGEVISTSDRPFEDVNNFPSLPYHILDMEKYIAKTRLGRRTINYISSQGCPYNCGFCPEATVHGKKWKALKPERVITDIENLVCKYNVDSIIFSDSEFFIDENRTKEICKGLLRFKIRWGRVNGRADRLVKFKPETWKLMKESGLETLLVGAESGLQECLDAMNKKITIEDVYKLSLISKEYGIKIQFSFFIGTPILSSDYSVDKELKETLNLIEKLYQTNPENEFLIAAYTPYPLTELYDVAKAKGFQEPNCFEGWSEFGLYKTTTPWIPAKYVKLCKQLTYYFFFISGAFDRTVRNFPILVRIIFKTFSAPLALLMRLRFKKRFFKFPVEYYFVQIGIGFKNLIDNIVRAILMLYSKLPFS